MPLYTEYKNLPAIARGASIALGNFDGVHSGHKAVLDAARAGAKMHVASLGVAVFEPPPRRYFQPDAEPFRVMRPARRAEKLFGLGVDHVFELPFDTDMAGMSADDFIQTVLVDGMGVSHVSVGFDYRFGKGRAGDTKTLIAAGEAIGFGVTIVEEIEGFGEKASSTAIRNALTSGNPQKAADLLGEYWIADGTVAHGEKRGRTIGFPTANLHLEHLIHPRHGVYSVWAKVNEEARWYGGVANFGRTPTTGEREPLLEVFLFDFEGNLYDQHMSVAFVDFIRPEVKFNSLDELVAEMKNDEAKARAQLAQVKSPA